MTERDGQGLSSMDRKLLLWASFLALTAAACGFVLRAMVPQLWGAEFGVSETQIGQLLGAGLWPIAIMMIVFSLLVDKIGYKISMYCALFFQILSVVLTFCADSFSTMWVACICAGLGHGIVEATINPLIASVYRNEKTKYLTILHASWPAGIVAGGIVYMTLYQNAETWAAAKTAWFFMLLPVMIYGGLYFLCHRFPVDERVEAKVPYIDMLRELGGLGAFLAVTFIAYEVYNQLGLFAEGQFSRLLASFAVGVAGGAGFGFAVRSKGRWMFFFLCVLMIPLATAELATDAWIQKLMRSALNEYSGWALVFSAFIMMILRFFAGIPLRYMGPLGLLLISSVFSIIGLFWLSVAHGILILVAFVFYAVGQTFYWPAVLGFTSEQYPRGGALTLNTVSAMGLLTVGIFGGPFLGALQDNFDAKTVMKNHPALVKQIQDEGRTVVVKGNAKQIIEREIFFGVDYPIVRVDAFMEQPEFPAEAKEPLKEKLKNTGRMTLRAATSLPITMAIGFFLILMWFRKTQGGYKPVELTPHEHPDTQAK